MIHIKAKVLGALLAAFALGVAAIAVPGIATAEEAAPEAPAAAEPAPEASSPFEVTPLAEESCPSGNVCAWPKPHYQGTRGDSLCTGGLHTLAGSKQSAKNRCANKAAWLRIQQIAAWCLNPGENLTEGFEGFYEIWIGAEGSRC